VDAREIAGRKIPHRNFDVHALNHGPVAVPPVKLYGV
jgi:hypothetical protein